MLAIWRTAHESLKQGKLLIYEFGFIRTPQHKKYVEDSFKEIRAELKPPYLDKLMNELWPKIDTKGATELGTATPESKVNTRLLDDIRAGRPIVRFAIARELERYMGILVDPSQFSFDFGMVQQDTLKATTNIPEIYGLGPR